MRDICSPNECVQSLGFIAWRPSLRLCRRQWLCGRSSCGVWSSLLICLATTTWTYIYNAFGGMNENPVCRRVDGRRAIVNHRLGHTYYDGDAHYGLYVVVIQVRWSADDITHDMFVVYGFFISRRVIVL